MSILAVGLNYRTAAIELRERIAFPADDVVRALSALRGSIQSVSEAVILSTCNRTEIYCATVADDTSTLREWIAGDRRVRDERLRSALYALKDADAAHHAMRVAAGLDSQVLGEPQIMGQFKQAFEVAREAGAVGPQLDLLSQMSLNVAKTVRTETEIGKNPVSVAYAAVSLVRKIFSDPRRSKALLIGAGETVRLVAAHLQRTGIGGIACANRTLEHARELAGRYAGDAMPLNDIGSRLGEFDVVVSGTGSALPVVGKGMVENAIRKRRHRPMFMVDLAVPRDIEPEVAELEDVYLYSIDDLTEIIEENARGRREAAQAAETLVSQGADRFARELRIREGQELLRAFRHRGDGLRQEAVDAALRRLANGEDAAEVIDRLSRELTNKLLHGSTVAIREAAAEDQAELLELLRQSHDIRI